MMINLYREWKADNQYIVTAGFVLAWIVGMFIGGWLGMVVFG